MPEWLKLLLAANNSLGFADTLQKLTSINPVYKQTRNNNIQGQVSSEPEGVTLSLNEKKIQNVPFTIGHEFGHIAGSGQGNPTMGDEFLKIDPKAYKSENFANDFSTTVQFLRSHSSDMKSLSKKQRKIAEVVLKHEIYKDHPINKLNQTLAQLSKLLSKNVIQP